MNRQINPDHCAEIDGVSYMLVPVAGTPEWHVLKDGRKHRTFTSLTAAKGWLEHVLENGNRYFDLANEWRETLAKDDPRRDSTVITRPNDPASQNFLDVWNMSRIKDRPRVIVAGGGSAEFKAKLAAALVAALKGGKS